MPFADQQGRVTELRADRRPAEERRSARAARVAPSSLAPAAGVRATALFRLPAELSLAPTAGGVFVEVSGDASDITVEIFDGSGAPMWFEPLLVEGAGTLRHEFRLPPERSIAGLRVVSDGAGGELELLAAGVAIVGPRLSFAPGLAVTGSYFPLAGVHRVDGSAGVPFGLRARVAPELWEGLADDGWLIALRLWSTGATEAVVTLYDRPLAAGEGSTARPDSTARYRVRLAGGERFVHIPSALLQFRPQALTVEGRDVGVVSLAHELLPGAREGVEPLAIPADAAAVLAVRPERWRQPEYELYAWNAAPTRAPVLIFDTRDYNTQARLFRRLAYFAEKRGYRGAVHSDQALEGRRGWNAHDYTAADLAQFFSVAANDGVVLTEEELRLRQHLLDHGVILTAEGGWRAGEGAVLSISYESNPWLRGVLLNHELLHGVFFTVPGFEVAAEGIWLGLDGQSRQFWRRLFRHIGYDDAHERLMINEFQAYTLQQSRDGLMSWLRTWGQRLRTRYPDEADAIDLMVADQDGHLAAYDQLRNALLVTTGLDSEELALMSVE